MTDLYKVLEIDEEADKKAIKKAYYKLASKHHPDKGGNPDEFKKICSAYEILSDPERKRIYDEDGIIVNDSEDILNQWVFQTFAQLVETWIKTKVAGQQRIPGFPEFVENNIKQNKEKAENLIEEVRTKKEKLEKYKKFADVENGNNIFAKVLNKLNKELEDHLMAGNTGIYRMHLLEKEFERYNFSEMEDDDAMEFVTTFKISTDAEGYGFDGGFSSTYSSAT